MSQFDFDFNEKGPHNEIKVYPTYWSFNGVNLSRPEGLKDSAVVEACRKDNLCSNCLKPFQIETRKRFGKTMLTGLVLLYHAHNRLKKWDSFIFIDDIVAPVSGNSAARIRGDLSKWKHWGLIEKLEAPRYDGMPSKQRRNGMYRITDYGVQWVKGLCTVPQFCVVYNDTKLGDYGDQVYIYDCKPQNFNWHEAFYGAPPEQE